MKDLYKELIIDHGINPKNKKILKNYTHMIPAINHLCGDMFVLYINIKDNLIKEISFEGKGCSVSIASASIMTLLLKEKTIKNASKIFLHLINKIKEEKEEAETEVKIKEIEILSNIKNYPSRVKCCTLIWHAMNNVLNKDDKH